MPPGNPKELERFMGKGEMAHTICEIFGTCSMPSISTHQEGCTVCMDGKCQYSFELLKKMLTKAPVMVSLDWTKIFHVYTDASNRALGGTLM